MPWSIASRELAEQDWLERWTAMTPDQRAEYDRLTEEIRRQDEAVGEWPTVAWFEESYRKELR